MSNFKSTYATDNRVESTVHIISHYLRAATNKLGAKKADTDYFVMTDKLVEDLINYYKNRDAKSALVVDDIGLQVINRLIQEGVKDITLALARVPKENLETVKYIIHNTFTDFNIKIVSIEEAKGMNVDLVISNPPYGKIGAEITKKIIDTVDFKEYINLLPANDYKRVNGLWNYQSDMRPGSKPGTSAFSDAAVTTHIARVHKTKVNTMTDDDFTIAQFIDPQLNKYFKKNYNRSYYAFDEFDCGRGDNVLNWTVEKTFVLAGRDINHRAMPKSKTCSSYRWNVLEDMTNKEFVDKHIVSRAIKGNFIEVEFSGINFKSNIEKKNFVKFIYTGNEAKFVQKLFTAINCDGGSFIVHHIFPKVDWTRSWTVEEILKDYDYTEEEIKEVMEDLKNFKGMED